MKWVWAVLVSQCVCGEDSFGVDNVPSFCSASSFEQDVDYHDGQGVGHASGANAESCCAQCAKFPGCSYFTYAPTYVGSECWFKKDNQGAQACPGCVSGGIGDAAAPPPSPSPPAPPAPCSAFPCVKPTGDPEDVWSAVDTLHKCHFIDVPDIPARAFLDNKNLTHMIVGSTNFHRMSGVSVLKQTRDCATAWNKTGNPDPKQFSANEFLDSPIVFENGTVVSLVHTEYPGNIYNSTGPQAPMCTVGSYPHCWTVTIGLAISHDWGMTWQHARPPPNHLVAAVPYGYNQSQLAYGWGDPSNIVKHPSDGYYYAAIWNRNQVGLQEPGICIMRTASLMDPSAWRAWDGNDYTVSFVSPYTMEPGTEAKHICKVTNLPAGSAVPIKGKPLGCAPAGLVWSKYLRKFVVTLGCGSKFQWSLSDDLITWSDPQELYDPHTSISNATIAKMVRGMNYPTFIDPTAPSAFGDRNFYTIGQNPYLFWVSIGHSPYSDGRHLWATPMSFQNQSVPELIFA